MWLNVKKFFIYARQFLFATMYLTFEEELLNHCLSFGLVYVHHSHLGTSLTQGMSKPPANALPATCHIGHLPIQTHPIQDEMPLDTSKDFVVRNVILMDKI